MTQNIYDDEAFFAEYCKLERSIHGLDGAPEWPALTGASPIPPPAELLATEPLPPAGAISPMPDRTDVSASIAS